MDADDRFKLAETLWTLGAGHAEAVRELLKIARLKARKLGLPASDVTVFNGGLSISIHLLMGYSFELLLKAAFIHCEGDASKLKAIGHDLIAALDHAERCGFKSQVVDLRGMLSSPRHAHLSHQFRYGRDDEVHIPPPAATEPALDLLATELGALMFRWGETGQP